MASVDREILKALEALREKDPQLSAASVLAAAQNPESPLHRCFVWDDTEAARLYRLRQANQLVRAIKVSVSNHTRKELRVSVLAQARHTVSVPITSRESPLDTAVRELKSIKARYGHLQELGDVFQALDKFLIAKEDPKKAVLRSAAYRAKKLEDEQGLDRRSAAARAAQEYKLPLSVVVEELRLVS